MENFEQDKASASVSESNPFDSVLDASAITTVRKLRSETGNGQTEAERNGQTNNQNAQGQVIFINGQLVII